MSTHVVWAPSLLVALVVSCGGDGAVAVPDAAPDSGSALIEPLPLLELSADNAVLVAATVWQDVAETEAVRALGPAAALFGDTFPVAAYAAPGVQVEVGCPVSGTAFVVGAIGDPANPGKTAGDTLEVSYSDCDMGEESLFTQLDNGTLSLVVDEVSGDLVRSTLDIDMTSSIEGIGAISTVGSEQLAITRAGPITTVSFSAARFDADFNGQLFIIQDFSATLVDGGEEDDAPFELEYASTTSNPQLGGSYIVETPMRFKGLSNLNPSEGRLLITGAGGAQIKLQTLDPVLIQIDFDSDGDGTFEPEDSTITTWDELGRAE